MANKTKQNKTLANLQFEQVEIKKKSEHMSDSNMQKLICKQA